MEHRFTQWLIVTAVMLVAIIEVLDMTIVNVALSHMMGALGATRDQITWVLTSYIVASAIVMPLTGFLVNQVGRKKILLIDIIGFLIASGLCGCSNSLAEIVFFRMLQGAFGASLIPLSQYILLDTFTKEERAKAMAVWGMGIMVGPVLGPTIGGYITETMNWRWIFYINVPICLIAFLMTLQFIPETPRHPKKMDWVGLLLMVVGIGSLQILLDRGETDDWFESKQITLLFFTSMITLSLFIVRGLKIPDNIINLHLFRDWNFARSCLIMMMFAMGVFSLIALQPLMMQELMSYSPHLAGLVMGPRGLSSAVGMIIVAKYISRIDPRWFLLTGVIILSTTSFLMSQFSLLVSFKIMATISFFQGFGVGFFFVSLSTIAFNTLNSSEQAEASGLFNFSRNLGTSIGISLVSTYLARASQISWNNLISRIAVTNTDFLNWLSMLHLNLQDPKTIAYLSVEISRQSGMVAFINTFWLIGFFFLLSIPIIFFLKPPLKPTLHRLE